jgi:hypothetical protein
VSVIDLATRAVEIAGSAPGPGEDFMKQVARNLTDAVDGVLATRSHESRITRLGRA